MPADKPEVEEKSPSSKMDMKFILIAVIIFVAVMGCTFFMMKSMLAPLMPQKTTVHQKNEEGTLISVGEFTTNISDPSGPRYLKAEVVIEVKKDKKIEKEVNDYMPVLKDSILNILASTTIADLDARNREVLKQQIKNNLNQTLGSNKVLNVYFTTFLIQ